MIGACLALTEDFEALVLKAVERLPRRFRSRLDNVDIVVQDWPTPEQLESAGVKGRYGLLGLYEGVPLAARGANYTMVLPDKITIFRKPLERLGLKGEALEGEIAETVRHELAHHFGIGDRRLAELRSEAYEK